MRYGPRQPLNRGSNKLVPTNYAVTPQTVVAQWCFCDTHKQVLTGGGVRQFVSKNRLINQVAQGYFCDTYMQEPKLMLYLSGLCL
jgi:hypothetical protein